VPLQKVFDRLRAPRLARGGVAITQLPSAAIASASPFLAAAAWTVHSVLLMLLWSVWCASRRFPTSAFVRESRHTTDIKTSLIPYTKCTEVQSSHPQDAVCGTRSVAR